MVDELSSRVEPLEELTTLEERQLALLGVLIGKDNSVARMYIGALMARASEENPDYLSQACHSVRELIDNLPKYFQVTVKRTGSLKDQVISLQSAWGREPRVKNRSSKPLTERFAKKVEGLLNWFTDNFPARREVARTTVRELDVSGRRMPLPIEDVRADEWMAIRDWFVRSTHHGGCTSDEFDQWIYQFEMFLLNLAKPRPFDNADIIDELIAEGEADG